VNTLKRALNRRTAKISTPGIAIMRLLHGCSGQRRVIASFSATAGLIVTYSLFAE